MLWFKFSFKLLFYCSEFVHDALPTLGTTSAVRVMKNLVLSGEADEMEADIWFTSMSFISDPNREILSEVKVYKIRQNGLNNNYSVIAFCIFN